MNLKKPGVVSFEYFYPDDGIYFEFFVSVFKMTFNVDMPVLRNDLSTSSWFL